MDLARILKEPNSDAVYRCISPSLIEEPSCPIKVVEVIFVCLASPEVHICDFEVAPKMASRVPIRRLVMLWPSGAIRQPLHGVIIIDRKSVV